MIDIFLHWRDNATSLIMRCLLMPKIVDRTGEKHGRLLILGLSGIRGKDRLCWVRCDCGTEKKVVQSKITAKTKPILSCGCLAKDNHHRTHGMTKHKLYPVWKAMFSRCYNPSSKSYKDYGGRGISVCAEWRETPEYFIEWLELNGYKKGFQIDREDNDSDYSPNNCRVVTQQINCNNRRNTIRYNVDGDQLTITEMAEKYDIKYATLYNRIKSLGMPPMDALKMKPWQRVRPVGG